jgi:hypothetical protein
MCYILLTLLKEIMRNIQTYLLASFVFILLSGTHVCLAQGVSASDESRLLLVQAELDFYEQNALQPAPAPSFVQPAVAMFPTKPASQALFTKVRISGAVRAAVGLESDGTAFFTRANADLNERNYRLLTDRQLNNFSNTYDPAVYSRIKVVVDASIQDAVGMHLNVTVDPWSYTGKTAMKTVTSNWGDTADIQYLFWGNTGYTVNQNYVTGRFGDSFAMPEIKVTKGRVPATTVNGSWTDNWGGPHVFNVPEMKIDYNFQPVRELWFDLKPTDILSFRVFPLAYQDQALNSDDPLKLSNNKTFWEESP